MRKFLLATALAGAWSLGTAAHAEPTTWQFRYTGFQVDTIDVRWDIYVPPVTTTTSGFRPDATLSGSFSGSDANGNGVIELPELTAFSVERYGFFGCAPSGLDDVAYFACQIDKFAYTEGGPLDVEAHWEQAGEVYWSRNFRLASSGFDEGFGGRYSASSTAGRWTDATQMVVMPMPVPEPASGALAAAGVLLLAAARRRRQQQRR